MTMTETINDFSKVIRLQLKKPKSWNWQLSTSKSSPHIALPVIQLFNSKGQLLVEAKDNGDTRRRIWRGSGVQNTELPTSVNKESRESAARHLKRSRSDTSSYNSSGNILRNKEESINRKDRNRQPNNKIKSFDESLDNSVTRKTSDITHENRKSRTNATKVINGSEKTGRENPYNCLIKSKSDVFERKDNMLSPKTAVVKRNSSQSFREFVENAEARRYGRSGSADLFRQKLRYSEESIKRAEMDGYRNFITPNIPQDKSQEKPNRNKKTLMTAENVLLGNNTFNIEVNEFKPKKYKTRTSSAGTLIISEESFNNAHRHRRRCDAGDGAGNLRHSVPSASNTQPYARSSNATIGNVGTTKHIRQASDPTESKSGKYAFNRYPGAERTNEIYKSRDSCKIKATNPSAGLFYSHSDVFPFHEILTDKIDENSNDNCNYIVHEVTTPSESRKNSEGVIEKSNQKKRRKVRRRTVDGSTSSDTIEKGNRTKGHLINDHSTQKGSGGGDSDLLQLVRRLSSNDHVKMGANVSRHSAKGLSGRRSQSSGSICNGKGRHGDGKICSSLPSYLDERESNGCNNNHHECEKPPIDEVDRIPPLGDGAPLHWKFSDTQTALCDQGYGSERSPEEEYPPPLPDHDQQCHHHLEPHACYPFITPDSTFTVKLTKGTRGLGLSVTGGIDSSGSWPGLIRIKRLFPHQPASACGLLNVGDLLLEANGITLTGLTNYEALEVLRTAPNQVDLKICRPPPDVLNCVSPISEVPPPPPRREPPSSLNLPSAIYSTPEDDYYHGEFEVTLKKIQGSLGFTLRKEDDSALGHYVRALVREPALTDGRIRAGDKIIAVNDVEISPMSHEEAVQFLRQCSEIVRLRLYRDSAQTPVAALSPSETTPRTSFSRKAHLRQEAVDMLNDIAVRKLIPGNQDNYRRSLSPNASPRRLRRHPCPSDASHITDSSTKYMINDEQFHEGLLQQCSHPFDDDAFNSLFSIESDDGDKPSRPSSLDLYNPNQTPVAARKPRFNFSLAHNAYELNNLDPEVLDAPNLTYNLGNDDVKSTDVECGDSFPQEPASMPHIPIDNSAFSYKNPAYQSAHPQIGSDTIDSGVMAKPTKTDDTNMKKWKNVVLQDEEEITPRNDTHHPMKEEYEVLAIELNRGWNSRLGFSLQGAAGVTYVSAVHADSVAAKDGRLKPGDRVIKVNDETVEHMTTNEIIDLLRIVRGPVCIVVSRVKSNEDCPKSNAEN